MYCMWHGETELQNENSKGLMGTANWIFARMAPPFVSSLFVANGDKH